MNEAILNTWERENYTVEERSFDYSLHKFVVIQSDKEQTIYPNTIEDMEAIIDDLNNGADVNGWENGNGETIVID